MELESKLFVGTTTLWSNAVNGLIVFFFYPFSTLVLSLEIYEEGLILNFRFSWLQIRCIFVFLVCISLHQILCLTTC